MHKLLILVIQEFSNSVFYKKIAENIVMHIIIFCLRCQITVIYLHSWTPKLVLVYECYAWLISDLSENSSLPQI